MRTRPRSSDGPLTSLREAHGVSAYTTNQASGAKAPYGMVGVLADFPIDRNRRDAALRNMPKSIYPGTYGADLAAEIIYDLVVFALGSAVVIQTPPLTIKIFPLIRR